MKLFIFKTDLKNKKKVKVVKPIFNQHPWIIDWSVDTEDEDKVLRIEASENLSENDIIYLIKIHGFYCEVLPD